MADEWGPWIEHDGLSFPVPPGEILYVRDKIGREGSGQVQPPDPFAIGDCFIWASLHPLHWHWAIVAYRRLRPKALQNLIDLVENLPVPQEMEPAHG
ncbi:MAG: hypothetical protein DI533_00330 [Cereibacter sphaeroides]|uniref:Uncharacterized protein n=1 Tax=Cereibacter sphaeroides TaxID=1063 RepID=A0A2W5SB22_CERSP|nr:MAG: hypothetical protein DI533_00330 [Cereibacter sphaeroides]